MSLCTVAARSSRSTTSESLVSGIDLSPVAGGALARPKAARKQRAQSTARLRTGRGLTALRFALGLYPCCVATI